MFHQNQKEKRRTSLSVQRPPFSGLSSFFLILDWLFLALYAIIAQSVLESCTRCSAYSFIRLFVCGLLIHLIGDDQFVVLRLVSASQIFFDVESVLFVGIREVFVIRMPRDVVLI